MHSSASSCQSSHSSARCSSLGRHRSRKDESRSAGPSPALGQRALVELGRDLVGVPQHLAEEQLLGVEVVVQQAGRHPGRTGDRGHPDLGQAVADDAVGGSGQDPGARLRGRLLALAGSGRRGGARPALPVEARDRSAVMAPTRLTVQSVSDARISRVRRQGSPSAASAPSADAASSPLPGPRRRLRRTGSRPCSRPARSRWSAPATTPPSGATSSPGGRWRRRGDRTVLLVSRRGDEVLGVPTHASAAGRRGRARPARRPGRAVRAGGGLRGRGGRRGRRRGPGDRGDHRGALRDRCRGGQAGGRGRWRSPATPARCWSAPTASASSTPRPASSWPRRCSRPATWPCSARAATWPSTSPACWPTAAWACPGSSRSATRRTSASST